MKNASVVHSISARNSSGVAPATTTIAPAPSMATIEGSRSQPRVHPEGHPSRPSARHVVSEMATVGLLQPGSRIAPPGSGHGRRLVEGFNAMLDRLEQERSASNAKALAAQEAERHRIAQELHDEVGQSLTVVLLGLKQVEQRLPPSSRDELGAAP